MQVRNREMHSSQETHTRGSRFPEGEGVVGMLPRRHHHTGLQDTGEETSPSHPQLIPLQSARERRRSRQQSIPARLRQQKRAQDRRRGRIWEAMVTASFTLVWAGVAFTGLVKLRPVQQGTHHSLATLSSEVEQLQARVNRARRKVELGLDPTQSEIAIRESLNYVPFNQLGVVFEEPAIPGE